MKKIVSVAAALVALTLVCGTSFARDFTGKKGLTQTTETAQSKAKPEKAEKAPEEKKESPKFPEKGWHKGFWITVMGGMTQAGHDTNIQTNRTFNGKFIPAVGLSLGYDIADWIGPMLQLEYGFATDQVGDGTANYPFENAREHELKIRLAARATLPYFMHADWQPKKWKIIPYFKLGGTGHALYVNAPTTGNKIGAWGGGVAIGAGLETLILDHIWLGIDITEDLMFLGSYYKTIGGVNTKLVNGGFTPMFSLMGMVGYHF